MFCNGRGNSFVTGIHLWGLTAHGEICIRLNIKVRRNTRVRIWISKAMNNLNGKIVYCVKISVVSKYTINMSLVSSLAPWLQIILLRVFVATWQTKKISNIFTYSQIFVSNERFFDI